jgi:hypothetical protein
MTRIVSNAGRLITAAVAVLVILGLTAGGALGKGEVRDMVGKVVAVEPGSKTIVIETTVGKSIMTVGAEVPDTASITAGKGAKKLADVKVGDKVRMKWLREEKGLVVQSIAIQ